jgi:hypothetical protein
VVSVEVTPIAPTDEVTTRNNRVEMVLDVLPADAPKFGWNKPIQ